MESKTQTSTVSTESDLKRRHRTAALVVNGLLLMTLLLIVVAFAAQDYIYRPGDPTLVGAVRITAVFFGMGAIVLRRTRFAAMRLQDVAALRGIPGLLATLERTTVQVAFLGGAIALMGFILTILTGDPTNMLFIGIAAIAVLLYCYPRRSGWQRVVQGIERRNDAGARSSSL